jgi:H+/Cl- antiporter ClcA
VPGVALAALGTLGFGAVLGPEAPVIALGSAIGAGIGAVLLATKFHAYAVSLGCGFRGGPIFPAVFLGVAMAGLAVVWFDTSPMLAVAVGAAAGMAAQTRLLFSPLIFAALLVGTAGTDAVPAAALASATAWLAISRLQPATRFGPSPDR